MKKFSLFILTLIMLSSVAVAQSTDKANAKKIYNPNDNAKEEIAIAVKKAASEGKHVLLQIGGNWCEWCIAFTEKVNTNDTLKTFLDENYIVYHLNTSKENKNKDVLASLGFPQRFGYPVFVVLDAKGNRIHTQNSVYMEEGKGYNTKKVLEFFKQWSPSAIDPTKY